MGRSGANPWLGSSGGGVQIGEMTPGRGNYLGVFRMRSLRLWRLWELAMQWGGGLMNNYTTEILTDLCVVRKLCITDVKYLIKAWLTVAFRLSREASERATMRRST
ncbi:hypothetical protein EVAR_100525_1 [Eumeta japonica]|uniref:Uncharacterized protein n=1 Tax=Eumeta variegata TaxID=151549 RepID=A0A4C2ABQ5_EUMVA|nr:hypothetical protein EVAR_100525_1 [Eumeta japonica]